MRPETDLLQLGVSAQKRPLEALTLAPGPGDWPWVLCLGAVHGDEVESLWVLDELRVRWTNDYPFAKIGAILWSPVNPDGVALTRRWNGNNVDLNRNLPTSDWTGEVKNPRYPPGPAPGSEPENQVLIRLIETRKPLAILSLHSFSQYQVNVNGPAREWGERLAKICSYPVTEDIGYPTPGSLGTYAGKERQIPTITLEIERGLPREKVLPLHLPVVHEAFKYWEERRS